MIEPGQTIEGFRVTHTERVAEIESDAIVLTHEVTGAECVVLSNSDDNKVFLASFLTPVSDDTGVPHILEHSVLNGSRKFPVKEPFLELIKSSLYTFLNAFTYPDKTIYPVASRNAQDFSNLMDVYLDAIFQPTLSRQTFMQEGWHVSLDDPAEQPVYSGVVYNEMLGSYSDPQRILGTALDRALFPDSPYGNDSGGDPASIPQLTYEQFVGFHQRYYHPANCRFLVYGDIDIHERLAHINSYLAEFGPAEVDKTIAKQPRFTEPVQVSKPYPIGADEDPARKTYALRAYLLDSPTDPVYLLSMSILSHILIGTEAAPLRKALIDSRLGEDCLSYGMEEDISETYFSVGLKGTEAANVEAMGALIDTTLADLVANGIDPRTIEASLNTTEFGLREANFGGYPKGLIYGLNALSGWMYGGDPLAHLRYEQTLATIKAEIANGGYFEGLIERHLLTNAHQVTLTLYPDTEVEPARLAALAQTMRDYKESLTEEQVGALIADCQKLEAAQLEPDSPEALATLPKLPLSCIDRDAEQLPFEVVSSEPYTLSFSEQPTQGIAYLRLAFDASGIGLDDLPCLPFFSRLLTQTGTTARSHVDLSQEIGIHTGGLHASYQSGGVMGDRARILSTLQVSGKTLADKLPKFIDLLSEIITDADLANASRIDELSHIARSRLRQSIVPSGHSYVSSRLGAYSSRIGIYRELTSGLSQYDFMEQLVGDVEATPEAVVERLTQMRSTVFRTGNLHLHLTGSREMLASLQAELPRLIEQLPASASTPVPYALTPLASGEGLMVPSKIQYVGKSVNLYDHGYRFSGQMEVMRKLLSRDYLWNKVRVQGNAYGCFGSFDYLSGLLTCVSYRDPNLGETIDAYDQFADYLENLTLDRDEFEKIIIGTMGSVDSPRTSDQKGGVAFSRYRAGITFDDIQRTRHEILDCSFEELRQMAPWFRHLTNDGHICVIGSSGKIKAETGRFREIRPVFAD